MIPKIDYHYDQQQVHSALFKRLVTSGFRGDIAVSRAERSVFSTDNSIYQVTPAGIVFPRNVNDLKVVAGVLLEPEFRSVTIAARGGGTGTNGQSLTTGVIVDCSRHMNRILEIDPVRRTARVESGVVKDQLNGALKSHGLFFAPELSTSNRATIGGMISTDACGQGSCLYGKTSNHVLGLRVVFLGGTEWWSQSVSAGKLSALQMRTDRVGAIYKVLDRIEGEKRDLIAQTFPSLNRFLTGYDLAHLRNSTGGIDLNAILCGSEGTLALIAEAELNLVPIPTCSALLIIRYSDFITALEDARTLVDLKVASVETIDEKVLGLAQLDVNWGYIERFFPKKAEIPAQGINIVEIIADSATELSECLQAITSHLSSRPLKGRLGYTSTSDSDEIQAIWEMRKSAVGLLGSVEGSARPVAFVEDTAVPPENLASYIREFRALLDGAGLEYGMFGHVDAGVLHVRPALDLTRDDHVALVRTISDKVVNLTRKYGGVLWGEHGKGLRSEYVPQFFGPLYTSLQEIKGTFDPYNQLNPGKIASPPTGKLLKVDEIALRGNYDRKVLDDIRAAFDNATYCNGNGACFDFHVSSAMCPSFKATHDRRFSPKGRAGLTREWLQRLSAMGVNPRAESQELGKSRKVNHLFRRAWNSLNPRNRNDFSHEVRAAMDTCLGCKACAGQCPVKVNVPAFRSKFLELYYDRYLRPPRAVLVGWIEETLPLLAKIRPIYNALVSSLPGKSMMKWAGLVALPKMPSTSLRNELQRRGIHVATVERVSLLSEPERQRTVVFVTDPFTSYFDPMTILDACELAEKLGFIPMLSAPCRNGKPLHVYGFLKAFDRVVSDTSRYLDTLFDLGVKLVGLEPSMTLTFRGEYRNAGVSGPKGDVLLPQEWLVANLEALDKKKMQSAKGQYTLLTHCTEQTNAPLSVGQWSDIFGRLGIRLELPKVGCCGMAGTFGHEAGNRVLSEKIYSLSWDGIVGKADSSTTLMATGYSCRSQTGLMAGRVLPHPLQVINGLFQLEARLCP